MAVYVDNMKQAWHGMIMCHMLADTEAELVAMAERIGVHRRHHQHPGTHRSHFDICKSKRALAVKAGAIEVESREIGRMLRERIKAHGATV